jgi:glucose uptake protein GlcU
MKRKIKLMMSSITSAVLLAPFAVMAQLKPPTTGETNLPGGSIFDIIKNVMMWLLGILGFIAVIGFVISGIMYLVAAGDEKRQETAKRAMYYSIIGVIVGLVGLVILYAVQNLLKGSGGTTTF